jgi:4-hydroxy-2-oxoheptanedioate aldolase
MTGEQFRRRMGVDGPGPHPSDSGGAAQPPLLGTLLTTDAALMLRQVLAVGPDFVFIDTEHVPMDRSTVAGLCVTLNSAGIPPVVRTMSRDPALATAAADAGAAAVVAPYVEDVEEVRALVGAVKHRPLKGEELDRRLRKEAASGDGDHNEGNGSAGGADRDARLGSYLADRNRALSAVINVESVPALRRIDSLLSVPGLDAVLVGPHDLSCSLGIPEDYGHSSFRDALGRILHAAKRYGRGVGIHFSYCGSVERAAEWLRMGFDFFIYQSDLFFVASGLAGSLRALRNIGSPASEPDGQASDGDGDAPVPDLHI